ncbi:response regulator [Paenibacillus rigui]|uniref:DNA-binding response regulator n=1 Tax=Paenibacillus rigui TaxID=554312 RepID=A0A229UTI2_9BACL|nr:response regulator [Paenibacillus rigui]OXM86738.1 DNA-binding response regulator [Paenibacillus rigui]
MYKLMIVDDDVIIRRGLTRNIDWESQGIKLSGSAGNGKEALLLAESLKPDLVVTDIRMPHMDGLELTERLIAKFPELKVILMTSYEEFEFAKKALKLKVFDYILKPFENDALLDTVNRAAAEYRREKSVRKQIIDSMPLLRQLFWEHLISGRFEETELATESEFLGIRLHASHYAASVIKIDDYRSPNMLNRFGQEMLKYCVGNIIEEMTRHLDPCYIIHYDGGEIVLVFGSDDEPVHMAHELHTLMEKLRANVETFLKTTITVGIGPVYERPLSLQHSYAEANAALEYRHITGTNQVFIAQEVHLQPEPETVSPQGWEKDLLVKVKLGMEEPAVSIIDQLEQDVLKRKRVPLQQVHILGTEIALLLYREFWEWIQTPQMEQRFGGFTHFCANLQTMTTSKQIFTTVRDFTVELISEICARRDSHQKQLMSKAYQYVETHFSREDLSLQDVANYVNVSPGYLSAMFKKIGNTTFSECLLKTRMEKALQLMSKDDCKAYEIAYQIGFSNPQYFSVCFKKYTGFSPSEYRSRRA